MSYETYDPNDTGEDINNESKSESYPGNCPKCGGYGYYQISGTDFNCANCNGTGHVDHVSENPEDYGCMGNASIYHKKSEFDGEMLFLAIICWIIAMGVAILSWFETGFITWQDIVNWFK